MWRTQVGQDRIRASPRQDPGSRHPAPSVDWAWRIILRPRSSLSVRFRRRQSLVSVHTTSANRQVKANR